MMLSLAVARAPPCATSPAGSASSSVTDACADSAAGNTPRAAAARRTAAFRSSGRYSVVFSTHVWYHRWRWRTGAGVVGRHRRRA